MHIHLPKPLHGWKEFANEIFVIVVGVLIALGFEQVVEELHWQHKVHEGEERLKGELALNYKSALYMLATAPCINAKLSLLEERLVDSGAVLDPAPREPAQSRMAALGVPPRTLNIAFRVMSTSVWQSLNADGTVQHMPAKLQYRLSFLSRNVENYVEKGKSRESLEVLGLSLPLDPSAKILLATEIENNRNNINSMILSAMQVAGGVRDLGYAPSDKDVRLFMETDPAGLIRRCRAQKLPVADWRAALDRQPKLEQYGV